MWCKWNFNLLKERIMEKNLDVIYEDNHVIVVVKPHNVPSQEDETKDEDMLSLVKKYIKEKYNKPGNVYVGLIHRLDRPTGGIMCFAKTSKSASRLSKEIQDGQMTKEYLTVLEGQLPLKTKHVTNYLKKDEETNTVKIVPMGETGAKKAELIYEVVETLNEFKEVELKKQNYKIDENSCLTEKQPKMIKQISSTLSLTKIQLLTGRSHQIRVQMANLKAPVYGDGKYGAKLGKTKELALWAYKLEFIHPTTKQKMTFKVLPDGDKEPWKRFNLLKV